jgi:cysteinyl-tRNA synthetase
VQALSPKNGEIPETVLYGDTKAPEGKAAEYLANFNKALEDDLSSPKALAVLWRLLKDTLIDPRDTLAAAFNMDTVLGLRLEEKTRSRAESGTDEGIERLIKERNEARKFKDFKAADEIRLKL